jgi:hypothetical protein
VADIVGEYHLGELAQQASRSIAGRPWFETRRFAALLTMWALNDANREFAVEPELIITVR